MRIELLVQGGEVGFELRRVHLVGRCSLVDSQESKSEAANGPRLNFRERKLAASPKSRLSFTPFSFAEYGTREQLGRSARWLTIDLQPRSKRNTVVALTQTDKKTKAHKGELINTIREQAEQFAYVWVFDVEHMRNNILQEVRTAWKGSR